MTTNLSRSRAWFLRYLELAEKFDRASITASYHSEYIKDVEKWANKLLFLQIYGIKITINIVMVPEKFDELYELAKYFYNRGLNKDFT